MSSPPSSRVPFLLGALAVGAMAFLGVLAGHWYTDWRETQRMERKVEGLRAGASTGLHAGDVFPDVPLVDLEGRPTSTGALPAGMPALVVFVSIDCDACTEAILDWSAGDALSSGVAVIAVADERHDYVRVYRERTRFPFPLYCDEDNRFGKDYDMDVYPTAVGVDANGRIAFVQHGFGRGYTLAEAVDQLASGGP